MLNCQCRIPNESRLSLSKKINDRNQQTRNYLVPTKRKVHLVNIKEQSKN
jgi:hypothetical protein